MPSLLVASDRLAPWGIPLYSTSSSRFNIGSRQSAIACSRELFKSIGDNVPTPLASASTVANGHPRRPSDILERPRARDAHVDKRCLPSGPNTPSFTPGLRIRTESLRAANHVNKYHSWKLRFDNPLRRLWSEISFLREGKSIDLCNHGWRCTPLQRCEE